jgi:cellulase (glycosyl hydrolase family 5)/predicted xylan-binding protein with Ca-dependent carbohydrate-binding module
VAVAVAEQGTLSGGNVQVISDPSASKGGAVKYGSNGSVNLQVKLPADADTLTLRVRGDQCSGAPEYTVTIDGAQVASGTVSSTSWTTATISKFLGAGTHNVSVAFTNYTFVVWPSCTRALYLDNATFAASANVDAPSNPPIPAGFVHQSGRQLLDGADRPLKLRGVDLGGWLSWQGWIWGQGFDYIGESAMMNNLVSLVGQTQANQFQSEVYANYITASDFRAMSEGGLNVARLPFNYRLLEDDSNPFVYKQSGWAVLDQAVSEAKANNVYLVLDMEVAPCSQTLGFTADYVGGAFLWSSQQCQDRMVAMWQAIAARYANQNVIAGYDLLNEPMIDNQQLLALYERATAAIRQVDHNHLIIYEGNDLARTFDLFTAPMDTNEMLEFHDYSWMIPGQDLTARMPTYDAAATAINAPQWAGEFGQDVYSGIAHYVSTFNQDPLVAGWADWTWKQSPGLPALQTLQLSPTAQMLIDWMNNTTRPKPTLAQAQQSMSDFINDIQFANTLPDARMEQILSGVAGAPMAVAQTASTAQTAPTTQTAPISQTPPASGGKPAASRPHARASRRGSKASRVRHRRKMTLRRGRALGSRRSRDRRPALRVR